MRKHENRKVVSLRVAPSVLKKLDDIVDLLGKDSTWWNNPHTRELGYRMKAKVSRADVLAILVLKEYEVIHENEIQTGR